MSGLAGYAPSRRNKRFFPVATFPLVWSVLLSVPIGPPKCDLHTETKAYCPVMPDHDFGVLYFGQARSVK